MTTAQFLGYLAPALFAVLVAAAGWLKGHSAQKAAKNAEEKAERALNGMADHPPGP